MSILNIGYIKKISDWVSGKFSPFVTASNHVTINYRRNGLSALTVTVSVEYLDRDGIVLKEVVLLNGVTGLEHTIKAVVYGDYRIKFTNNSGADYYFWASIEAPQIGFIGLYSAFNSPNGVTITTQVFNDNSIIKNKPIYRGKELLNFNTGNNYTTVEETLKDEVTSLLVDEKENVYCGKIQNGVNLASLEKYDKSGDLLWSRKQIKDTINSGTVLKMVSDNNGFIYSIDSLGSLTKNNKVGDDSEWQINFGSFFMRDVAIDIYGNIYACGDKQLKKINRKGEIMWEYTIGTGTIYSVAISDGFVYIGKSSVNEIVKINQSSANITTAPTIEWSYTYSYIPLDIQIIKNRIMWKAFNGSYDRFLVATLTDSTIIINNTLFLSAGLKGNYVMDDKKYFYVIVKNPANEVRKYSEKIVLDWTKKLECVGGDSFGNPITKNKNGEVFYAVWGNVVKINPDVLLNGYLLN